MRPCRFIDAINNLKIEWIESVVSVRAHTDLYSLTPVGGYGGFSQNVSARCAIGSETHEPVDDGGFEFFFTDRIPNRSVRLNDIPHVVERGLHVGHSRVVIKSRMIYRTQRTLPFRRRREDQKPRGPGAFGNVGGDDNECHPVCA